MQYRSLLSARVVQLMCVHWRDVCVSRSEWDEKVVLRVVLFWRVRACVRCARVNACDPLQPSTRVRACPWA